MPALLLARVVQGIGGGTIGVVQAYVADVSPPEQRTKSLGWLSAITSLGAVAGPAFGSLMVSLGGQEFVGLGAAGARARWSRSSPGGSSASRAGRRRRAPPRPA